MDKQLYQCDKCGLQLSLINGRGEDCPRCSGHFLPVHPLAVDPAWNQGAREICDYDGCDRIAKVMYWEKGTKSLLRARCDEHEHDQHISWDEDTLQREEKRLVSDIEKRLQAEVEMDKFDKM